MCLKQKIKGRKRYPARAHAGAAVPLQPGVRRLRQDSVSGAHSEGRSSRPRSASGGRRVRHADGLDSRRRAAAASADAPRSLPAWSRARSTSTCAPTRCCSKRSSTSSSRASISRSRSIVDGQREHHDFSVCREGGYDIAMEGIQRRGCRWLPRHDQHHALRRRRSQLACAHTSTS